jgi:hypothetical protein
VSFGTTRWVPTLPYAWFGGGRLEKQVKLLTGRLPYQVDEG